MIILYILLFPLVIILPIVGSWILFEKANRKGWEVLIPIHNAVTTIEISGNPGWWVFLYLVPFVNVVIYILVMNSFSKKFGHGTGYTLGLIFLPFIFLLMLAFGSSKYQSEELAESNSFNGGDDDDDDTTLISGSEVGGSAPISTPTVAPAPAPEPTPGPAPEPTPAPAPEPTPAPAPKPKAMAKTDSEEETIIQQKVHVEQPPKPVAEEKPIEVVDNDSMTVNQVFANEQERVIDLLQQTAETEDLAAPIQGQQVDSEESHSVNVKPKSNSGAKKNIIIISLLVAIIIALGAGLFIMWDKMKSSDNAQIETQTNGGDDDGSDGSDVDDDDDVVVGPLPSNTLTFTYGRYSGDIANGKANGRGKMVYTKRTLISKFDINKKYAEPGQFIIGNWYSNELDFGTLYDKNGIVIETISIGRAE